MAEDGPNPRAGCRNCSRRENSDSARPPMPGSWARRCAGAAAVGTVGPTSADEFIGTSMPLRLRFELSRSAFQAAAARAAAGDCVQAGRIGLFEIDAVVPLSAGVGFVDNSAGFIDRCGIAYSATGTPDIDSLDVDPGGGWWFACEDFKVACPGLHRETRIAGPVRPRGARVCHCGGSSGHTAVLVPGSGESRRETSHETGVVTREDRPRGRRLQRSHRHACARL